MPDAASTDQSTDQTPDQLLAPFSDGSAAEETRAERPSLMLLDTASLYFRAFFGMPDSLRAPDGRPVNAVRGLLDFMARLVGEYHPTHLVCCWDNDWRPPWRVELVPSYKAHRLGHATTDVVGAGGVGAASGQAEEAPDELSPQVPLILDVLASLGVAVVGADGYEADDVIGTLAAGADGWAMTAEVVTGDRDLFQVVDDDRGVRVLYVARGVGRHERVDDGWVRRKYGISAQQYVDFATLRGDPSDGLPGVAGVGEKTASSLLAKYGSLAEILAASSEPDTAIPAGVRTKLAAALDYLAVAPQVVAVATDLDLGIGPDDVVLPAAPVDPEGFLRLTDELGLGSSAQRILAALAG